MNFEFEDYREKGPPPSYTEWSPNDPIRYCMIQTGFLFVLPYLLGFSLTPIGLLFNVILLDYILYKRAVTKPY